MDISAEKLKLIEMLLQTNNPSIINRIKTIFQMEETQDFWEHLDDGQQSEINKALNEVKNGEVVPFQNFIQKHK